MLSLMTDARELHMMPKTMTFNVNIFDKAKTDEKTLALHPFESGMQHWSHQWDVFVWVATRAATKSF
jgi:hypothetical protein